MNKTTNSVLAGLLIGGVLAWLTALVFARDFSKPNWEIFTEMAHSQAAESQGVNPELPGGTVQQPAPDGTVFRGQEVYPYEKTDEGRAAAKRELANPYDYLWPDPAFDAATASEPALAADADRRSRLQPLIARGERVFQNSCSACHDRTGAGGGPLNSAPYSMGASNLVGDVAKGLADGEIYHVITVGGTKMPAHADRVRPDDRWKLILYLRTLQGKKP